MSSKTNKKKSVLPIKGAVSSSPNHIKNKQSPDYSDFIKGNILDSARRGGGKSINNNPKKNTQQGSLFSNSIYDNNSRFQITSLFSGNNRRPST